MRPSAKSLRSLRPMIACAVGFASMASGEDVPVKPLNVLWIIADDLNTSLGCYGNPQVKSPNIDRLAGMGVRFDRAYCQYPVCNPSRSSFLTGLRPDHAGILDNGTCLRLERPELVTLPQLFRENGYFTASVGKITHTGVNEDGKIVHFEDPPAYEGFFDGVTTKLGKKGEGRNMTGGKIGWCRWLAAEGEDEDQKDGQNAVEAIRMLEAHQDGPFFIGVGFHKPHDPFHAPKKYFDLYPLEDIELADEPDDRSKRVKRAIPNDKDFAQFTDKDRREFRRSYYAGVSFTDAQIGKLMATMDRLKLWDNTIVIMMGDHGYHLGEHEWWNKVTVYEWGARAPFMIWVPGMQGMGNSTEGIIEYVDIYSTIADLCGLKVPHPQDGESFRSLLENPAGDGKEAAFTQVTRGSMMGRSIRTDRWRYTEWDGGRQGIELYDHDSDSGEYHNLSGNPEYKDLIGKLSDRLKESSGAR